MKIRHEKWYKVLIGGVKIKMRKKNKNEGKSSFLSNYSFEMYIRNIFYSGTIGKLNDEINDLKARIMTLESNK